VFNGPKGIWTVDLRGKAIGKAEIRAKLKGTDVAKVEVTVLNAEFTLEDDKTKVLTTAMLVSRNTRLHLTGVQADKSALGVQSTNPAVLAVTGVSVFNSSKGIWSIDLHTQATGKAEIRAKLQKMEVAKVAVMVVNSKFTLTYDQAAVATVKMHMGGRKQLRLVDAGSDAKALLVESANRPIADVTKVSLFDGTNGIWTVELSAKTKKGEAQIRAKLHGTEVAKVPVTVVDKVALKEPSSEVGLLERLLLAESRGPGQAGYDALKSKTAMQWMRVVLANRLKNPAPFNAKGAKTLKDIIKAPGQFKGFQDYPKLGAGQSKVITERINIVNDDNNQHEEEYRQFHQDVLDVAASGVLISDPCPTGLYGWRTAGSEEPGGDLVKWGEPVAGLQFYTLKKP